MQQRLAIKTTTQEPKLLAWLALKHRLHSVGILQKALLDCLLDRKAHDIAMTFVNDEPACVVLLADYGQLMAYTRRKYRRLGLAKRTAKLLSRRTGTHFTDMTGGPGKQPETSKAFFNHLGVEFIL